MIAQCEALASRYEHVITAPYPAMTHRIGLTAWDRNLPRDAYDEAQISTFIAAYTGLDHYPRGL